MSLKRGRVVIGRGRLGGKATIGVTLRFRLDGEACVKRGIRRRELRHGVTKIHCRCLMRKMSRSEKMTV